MNEWALSWLRAMKAPPPAPAQGAHDRHREQQTRRLAAVTPHLLGAPVTPPRESLDDLERYEFRCAGLCPGGMCPRCDGLADEIGWARLFPADYRRAREADLTQQINALREGQA